MNTNLTKEQKDYAIFLPALSGFFATFVGKQRREVYVDNARIQFEFVSDEYGNNQSSNLAKYYLARLHFDEKDYLAATSYLNEIRNVKFPLNHFSVSTFKMMALIAIENKDYDNAVSYYQRALSSSDLEDQKHLISCLLYTSPSPRD